jgi:hypothetical protein
MLKRTRLDLALGPGQAPLELAHGDGRAVPGRFVEGAAAKKNRARNRGAVEDRSGERGDEGTQKVLVAWKAESGAKCNVVCVCVCVCVCMCVCV